MAAIDYIDFDDDAYMDEYDLEDEFTSLWVEVTSETPKALQCRTQDNTRFWIAKKLIELSSAVSQMGDRGTLVIPRWKARELQLD